ncbi:MAG TPA: GNAT family N-acetyltransferase [Dehalococcoidia bacterium]
MNEPPLPETTRLRLLPLGAEHLRALMDGRSQFEALIGFAAASGLGDHLHSDEVSPAWREALRSATGRDPWRHGFGMLYRDDATVVGTVGFKGPPDDEGAVEISYGVRPDYENRGITTEGAGAAVQWAFSNPGVQSVIAHTLPSNIASQRVLQKNGFLLLGEVVDPEDGLVLRWQRLRSPQD